MIYGTLWCASNHIVCLSDRSGLILDQVLFKIRFNFMHPSRWCTTCAVGVIQHDYASPRCRASLYSMNDILKSVSLRNDLGDPAFDGVGLADLKSTADAFLFAYPARSTFVFYCFRFLFFLSICLCSWAAVYRLIMCTNYNSTQVYFTRLFSSFLAAGTRRRCSSNRDRQDISAQLPHHGYLQS